MKKRFFAKHARSSAMVISLAIHAFVIVVAISFVVANVIVKEETVFETRKVKRPNMPLKKIQVPVDMNKKKPKPQLRMRIVTTPKTFNAIKMPEITGVKGGLGNMGGTGLASVGFDLDVGDLFGGNKSMGNELVGTFYDLKQTKDGKPVEMNTGRFFEVLTEFATGWRRYRLDNYFQSPLKKYSSFFMIPMIPSASATKAFGVEKTVKPVYWAAYYEGHIAAPATGRFRFYGYGDDVLLVRINKRLVLNAGYEPNKALLKVRWDSNDANNRKYPFGRRRDLLFIGDWIEMTKGEPVLMEVLIADAGGECSSQLLIEQEGVQYEKVDYTYGNTSGSRPILPIFKMREIPKELHAEMQINLKEATLSGPVFGVKME